MLARPGALALAPALFLVAILPALAPTAGATAALAYDFEPGGSAVAIRTDANLVRCFRFQLDAELVAGVSNESAMVGLYLMDKLGAPQYAHVRVYRASGSTPGVGLMATTPDGTSGERVRVGFPQQPGPWNVHVDATHCFPAGRTQVSVFAAVTSVPVTSGRVVFTATDGDLFARQVVTGTGFGLAAHDFHGGGAEAGAFYAGSAHVLQRDVTFQKGFLGSFVSFDTAYALTVEGDGYVRTQYEAGSCPSVPGIPCVAVGSSSTGTLFLRAAAGAYRFTAAAATADLYGGPGANVHLLAADLRLPLGP